MSIYYEYADLLICRFDDLICSDLTSGMNVVGFCEPLLTNFGKTSGTIAQIIPDGYGYKFLYSSALLFICSCSCVMGSSFFTKSSRFLFGILLIATVSIPVSTLIVQPYVDSRFEAIYTGVSWTTIKQNLLPRFTSGAAGSQIKGKETFQDMFGIFFPATSGIFAGASMSGDLRKPSKSIPKGTLWGLLCTFIAYSLVILSVGSTVSRELLYRDVDVIQNTNMSSTLIIMGELSTSLFSVLMGLVGAAKLLQAMSRDNLIPYSSKLASGTKKTDNPIVAITLSYFLAQLTLFFDINQIAIFITMAYLMTFVATNVACFLLKIASAPNFRPSFRYFSTATAGVGAFSCVLAMFVADGVSASAMIIVLVTLFLTIHYISPPKPWGDVSQTLIYHQVRKYLLRLRQDHVKFWRPQILLLVDNPRTQWNLIHFCNHLKKGGLYILGHVMVTSDFHDSFPEMKKQQDSWAKLRDYANIKGFVQVAAGPTVVWGARNVYMGSGLGGMKPNITVMGFFEKQNHYSGFANTDYNREQQTNLQMENLPTDTCRKEPSIKATEWVNIIEDLLTMHANIAIARGFSRLQFPFELHKGPRAGYIDLYPIQMSAQITDEKGDISASSTNFDTYTLILQMGAILNTVPVWKRSHILRVIVFVEYLDHIKGERLRIQALLEKLRINAEVLVLCLNSGLETYDAIIHGRADTSGNVERCLGSYDWWQDIKKLRSNNGSYNVNVTTKPTAIAGTELEQALKRKRRNTISSLQRLGVSFSMQTSNLRKSGISGVSRYRDASSDSEGVSSDDGESEVELDSEDDSAFAIDERFSRIQTLWRRRSYGDSMSQISQQNSQQNSPQLVPTRPPLMKTLSSSSNLRDKSRAKKLMPSFSGTMTPPTKLLDDAEAGVPLSIAFDGLPKPARNIGVSRLIYGGVEFDDPDDSNMPLSFNDLPAKAQHVILNELMRKHSQDSVVLFSTLPAPSLGTYASEGDSLDYIDSLDLLCHGLPPTILLHSHSMTVTTAL